MTLYFYVQNSHTTCTKFSSKAFDNSWFIWKHIYSWCCDPSPNFSFRNKGCILNCWECCQKTDVDCRSSVEFVLLKIVSVKEMLPSRGTYIEWQINKGLLFLPKPRNLWRATLIPIDLARAFWGLLYSILLHICSHMFTPWSSL